MADPLNTSSFDLSSIDGEVESFDIEKSTKSPDTHAKEFIFESLKKANPPVSEIYRELLRSLLNIFNQFSYLDSEGKVRPVKCVHGNPERVVAKMHQEDNIILPIISIFQPFSENADKRRKFYSTVVTETVWDPISRRAQRVVSLVPRAIDIEYVVNLWGEYKSDIDQLTEQIYYQFNPTIAVETPFSELTQAFIDRETDESSVNVGDREDRVLKKSFVVKVQTYIPSPKFLFTNTGRIEKFNAQLTTVTKRKT